MIPRRNIPDRIQWLLAAVMGAVALCMIFAQDGLLPTLGVGFLWACIIAPCVSGVIGRLIVLLVIFLFIVAIIVFSTLNLVEALNAA